MEPNIQNQPQPLKPTGGAPSPGSAAATASQSVMDKVSDTAQAVREQVVDRGSELMDQAKQKAGEAYEQTSKTVTEQYEKARDYGRENPGKTTLIAFGVGIGVGVWLASSVGGSRRSSNRLVEPVMNAVSSLARELFR